MLEIQIHFVSNGRRTATLEELVNIVADKVVQRIAPQLKHLPRPVPAAMAATSPVQKPGEQPQVSWPEAKLVTVAAASKLLGLSRTTIWRHISEKRIETVHIGPHSTRIRMETINRIVSEGIPGKRSS